MLHLSQILHNRSLCKSIAMVMPSLRHMQMMEMVIRMW